MGEQVIRQPDGKLAVFSSVTDTIHVYDATPAELADWYVERAAERARIEINRIIDHVQRGEERALYFQFTKSWDEALKLDAEHGGDAHREFVGT